MTRTRSSKKPNTSENRYPLRIKGRTSGEPDSAEHQLKPNKLKNSKRMKRAKRNKQIPQNFCPCGKPYGGRGGFDGKMIECRNKSCKQWWHPTCTDIKGIPGENEDWHCSRCRSAGDADPTEDAGGHWNNRPKHSPDGGLGGRDDEKRLKDSFFFDDLFMSRTDHLQLDDRSIEGRMSQIDDLILQVAASYTTKELNVLPDPDFDQIENKYPELASRVRSTFGLAADRPLTRELLLLGTHEWGTMDIFRVFIAVSVQDWVFHSWFPEFLSPDSSVQTVLKAGYKMAQERGEIRFQKAQQRFWHDLLVGICGTRELGKEICTEASKLAARTADLLKPLRDDRVRNDMYLSGSFDQQSARKAELLKKLDRLFVESLKLKLDLTLKHGDTWFFWPLPNETYDSRRMTIDDEIVMNEEVLRGRKVRLGLLPGVSGFKEVDDGREPCILSKARVIL